MRCINNVLINNIDQQIMEDVKQCTTKKAVLARLSERTTEKALTEPRLTIS